MKQVPVRDAILKINPAQRWIEEKDLSFEINESDHYALEEALRLKEKHGGQVVICSLGAARVKEAIRQGLAKGADRAIHIVDDGSGPLDPFVAASAMAQALRNEKYDLILTGLQSDDAGYAQTGVILAELLGIPHTTIVMEVQANPETGTVKVKRELESGWFQWIELPLPALLTIQSGINKIRYATLKGILQAKQKEIKEVKLADLPMENRWFDVHRMYMPLKTKKTEILQGDAKQVAEQLVQKLRTEAKVI